MIGNTMNTSFEISRLPKIIFGAGSLQRLTELAAGFGPSWLLVTGTQTLSRCSAWPAIASAMKSDKITCKQLVIDGEPTPDLIDSLVKAQAGHTIDCVIGLGGGSALDAAKAIAGLLRPGNSVRDHLEGVGPELPYRGPATPFIAVPTTAGTGAEATKNAVLSEGGAHAFKKSFRDERLIPEYAIIDPDLLATCPPALIAANGMDALTQLLESLVSTRANPLTDALAFDGIAKVRDSLLPWYLGAEEAATHRANMAYAALLSGITLAQVGLGSVHGLAAPLGAFFPVPHGVACGTLVAEATRLNIAALHARAPNDVALDKYARVGRLLAHDETLNQDAAINALVNTLAHWTQAMHLPPLGTFGISEADIATLVANSRGSSMKTNPIALTDAEIGALIRARL
jgi:alcohol dehydrogenase class IV